MSLSTPLAIANSAVPRSCGGAPLNSATMPALPGPIAFPETPGLTATHRLHDLPHDPNGQAKKPDTDPEAAEDAHGAAQPIPYHASMAPISSAASYTVPFTNTATIAGFSSSPATRSNRQSRDGRHSVPRRPGLISTPQGWRHSCGSTPNNCSNVAG